jgi:hypothetical protein
MILMDRLGLGCSGSRVVARLRSNDASALALSGPPHLKELKQIASPVPRQRYTYA